MISREQIESIKNGVDLVALVRSRGIVLKKNGKGYKGHCPFHEDNKTPSLSVTPDKNLWQCFGCQAGGDAIRFVELFDKVDFKAAVQLLAGPEVRSQRTEDKKAVKEKKEEKPELSVKEKKLLARVVGYYQHTFTEDQRGLEYLKARGISDTQAMQDFGVGYVSGTLKGILPEDSEIKATLQKVGILNRKGNEVLYNCVVFPLYDDEGHIVNLYGRNIDPESGASHLYLPGPKRGLVNRQAVKRSATIILTESVIDALTLYNQGFKNIIPAYGVNGLTEDHLSLFNGKIQEVYIVFDADEAGRNGATLVAGQLQEKGIASYPVALPDKDVNIYFQRHAPEEFERLLRTANPAGVEQSEKLNKRQQTLYREEEHGFTVGYGERQYQIKGIQRGDTQLKATIKVAKDVSSTQPFELTTIDLYSSRSRQWFAKLCSDLLCAAEELIREDLGKILVLVEEWRPREQKTSTPQPSKEDKEKALSFLSNPELFSEILCDFETMGVTGEEVNKLVGYLAATSR